MKKSARNNERDPKTESYNRMSKVLVNALSIYESLLLDRQQALEGMFSGFYGDKTSIRRMVELQHEVSDQISDVCMVLARLKRWDLLMNQLVDEMKKSSSYSFSKK